MELSLWLRVAAAALLMVATSTSGGADEAGNIFVVKNGYFTNVYVYRHPSTQTWEENLAALKADPHMGLEGIDLQTLSRKSIDAYTQAIMNPAFPSYFGALHQYGGINPPRFFGSYVASQHCVDAALKDLDSSVHDSDVTMNDGVMELPTVRSLANCHEPGMDPSTQVNLIFSPDIRLGQSDPNKFASDLCGPGSDESAYHSAGFNTPNFAAVSTAPGCISDFNDFTFNLSHEDVEILADPALMGHGGISSNPGEREPGDLCGPSSSTTWNGYKVQRYRSDNDNSCWPQDVAGDSPVITWVLAEGTPIVRFTGKNHSYTLNVPMVKDVTDAVVAGAQVWVQTGGDDLRGGSNSQGRVDAALLFKGGSTITTNINHADRWGGGQTHFGVLQLPNPPPRMSDLTGIELVTHFAGGISGDNWDVNKVALRLAYAKGSAVTQSSAPIEHTWLDISGGPLVRMTGQVHDFVATVPPQDIGRSIEALELIISTGNDDLRGGSHAGDNCDVLVQLGNQQVITVQNVNHSHGMSRWSDHNISIPIPPKGLVGGAVTHIAIKTNFGGGISGDNWNVQRLRLTATLSPLNGQSGTGGELPVKAR